MQSASAKPVTIDEYIVAAPAAARPHLQQIYQLVKAAAPQAQEKLSYGMPYFNLNGRLLYFGAFKDHLGFYPMKAAIAEFKDDLSEYTTGPGTVQFPYDKPLPDELINRIIKFRIEQNSQKQ